MFRRILQRTPGRVGSQGSDLDSSATPINTVDVNNESSSEGFICPLCMKNCVSALDLSEHYQEVHTEQETRGQELVSGSSVTGFICPQCMKSLGSADELFKHYQAVHDAGNDSGHGGEAGLALTRDDITLLRQEVQDLQASLKEEKWYSEELKKELEKYQGLQQQEAKSDGLVTDSSAELQALEQQLEEAQTENFNIKQMKDLFEQKAAQLATEIADIKSKYDEEKSLRAAAEQKVTHLTEDLNKQTTLNENLGTVKKEWQSSQRRVSELEKQTDDLRGEIAVLEATVQNNQDERRALLERCLKGEGEIEKLQTKALELQRKLDNTTAAVQELGRENQSLQIKHTQALNRKWAEDNEVQNCMSCGKCFSVTVRRHHCRQCGNIFCAECSTKNALTPSSKKSVRVCDACFNDLQG